MNVERLEKRSFSVIGKEGSTSEGPDFIPRLWADANAGFEDIQPLAKTDDQGVPIGIWGLMSDFSRSFQPWDGFCEGLYLAGVECVEGAKPPEGWTKWTVPGFEYLRVEGGADYFPQGLRYLKEKGLMLVGAVHDYTCPKTGRAYMFFPIRRL